MTQEPKPPLESCKTQSRRAPMMDQAQDFDARHQDRRQIRLRRGLVARITEEAGVAQAHSTIIREPSGNCSINCCLKSDGHGAFHPRSDRNGARGEAGKSSGLAPLRFHPRGARIPAVFSTKPNSLRRRATESISTIFPRPMFESKARAHARARSMTSATRNSRHRSHVHGRARYLSRRYSYTDGAAPAVPDHVISAYEKLITPAIYSPARRGQATMTGPDGMYW